MKNQIKKIVQPSFSFSITTALTILVFTVFSFQFSAEASGRQEPKFKGTYNGTITNKSEKDNIILSPDGKLKIVISLKNSTVGESFPVYSILFKGQPVITDSELGMKFSGTDTFKYNLKVNNVILREKNEEYPVNFGKTKTAVNNYREMDIVFEERDGLKRLMHIIFRAYNDGVAFRYFIPEEKNLKNFTITEELTTLSFEQDPKATYLTFDKYTNSHEGLYKTSLLSQIPSGATLIDLPITFEVSDSIYVAITEANVRNYPGMYLVKDKVSGNILHCSLSPLPHQTIDKVKASAPMKSPWRTIMIADKVGKLIESNLIDNLNEPCAIGDISWIKTGKTTWPWWNGTTANNVNFEVGVNTATTKYYIDFASANGIAFHAISDEDGQAWYGKSRGDQIAYQDVTKPISSLDMPEIIRYAKEKGVGIRLWVHYAALQSKLDSAFAVYGKWGIDGLMIDYLDRDDQEMMNFMEEVLQKAAKNHLKVQFHGAPKPTGLKRTYPNLTNTEGVLNLEYLKWSNSCTPAHNVMIPFTRMLAGPLDYHLGGFRSVTREEFAKGNPANPKNIVNGRTSNNYEPVVLGSRAHLMALYVVYENPEPMICDYPDAYKNQLGFEFILKVPTVWDDIKVINAKIGEYITIARKNDKDWYVGSITNWTPRELKIPLDFLPEGKFEAEIYSDTSETDRNPNKIALSRLIVTSKDILDAKLVSGGGHVVQFKPLIDSVKNQ